MNTIDTTDAASTNQEQLYMNGETGEIIYDLELIAEQRRAVVEEFRTHWAREFFIKDAFASAKEDPCPAAEPHLGLSAIYASSTSEPELGHPCPQCRESGIPAPLTERPRCAACGASPKTNIPDRVFPGSLHSGTTSSPADPSPKPPSPNLNRAHLSARPFGTCALPP